MRGVLLSRAEELSMSVTSGFQRPATCPGCVCVLLSRVCVSSCPECCVCPPVQGVCVCVLLSRVCVCPPVQSVVCVCPPVQGVCVLLSRVLCVCVSSCPGCVCVLLSRVCVCVSCQMLNLKWIRGLKIVDMDGYRIWINL